MLEYIFFNKKTCHLFDKYATSSGITPIIDYTDECYTVKLPEDLDDVILEKLENHYDELMDLDRTLSEQQDDDQENFHAAGITIQLNDGRVVCANVTPELLNKVLRSISTDELNTLVCAITKAVEDPDERGLCQR